MRSRRQGVSDAVSVLGMDPWKDDRVRDFVAINTIQRLRAYHLAPGAPMPPIEDVNADRALNLLLLPRADPDYRPCVGERPPTRAELRARHREQKRAVRQQKHKQEHAAASGKGEESQKRVHADRHPSLPASSSPSSASSSASDSDSDGDEQDGQREGGEEQETPKRHARTVDDLSPSPQPVSSAAASTQCAVDRARILFFGTSSFLSSTSPRRLVNSPHVPLTPSVTSSSPVAERLASHQATIAQSTPSGASPESQLAGKGKDEGPRAGVSAAARSLHTDLDVYIEANSTPLRLPPPLPPSVASNAVAPSEEDGQIERATPVKNISNSGGGVDSPALAPMGDEKKAERLESAVVGPPADATPVAARPQPDNTDAVRPALSAVEGDEETDQERHRSCDVCDAIIHYYQSMLTRGVVLDRYNHKDLAFAWWVLGRNMETSALENRGPMRREALLITIRNLYYSLLSAEEAKTKAHESLQDHTEPPRAPDGTVEGSSSISTINSGEPEAKAQAKSNATTSETVRVPHEEDEKGTGAAVAAQRLAGAPAPAAPARPRGRGRTPGVSAPASVPSQSSSDPSPVPLSAPSASTATTRKRARAGRDAQSPERDADAESRKEVEEEKEEAGATLEGITRRHHLPTSLADDARASTIATRAHARLPPMPSSRASASADTPVAAASLEQPTTEEPPEAKTAQPPLAAALRSDQVSEDGLAEGDAIDSASSSLISSATVSRAGSVAPAGPLSSVRRRRRAEDRRRVVEETWTSTRTSRRTASAKAAAEPVPAVPTVAPGVGSAASKAAEHGEDKRVAAMAPTSAAAAAAHRSLTTAPKGKPKSSGASKRVRSPSNRSVENSSEDNIDEGKLEKTTSSIAESAVAPKPRGKSASSLSKKAASGAVSASPLPATDKDAETKLDVNAEVASTAAAAAAKPVNAPASKLGKKQPQPPPKKTEEHRGRPRGSFKIPRIVVDGVAIPANAVKATKAAAAATSAAAAAASAMTSVRGGEKKREDATAISVSQGSSSSAPPPPLDESSLSRSSAPTVSADASKGPLMPREMPLGLTAHERLVRARIQRRMGVPLSPAPPSHSLLPPSTGEPFSHPASAPRTPVEASPVTTTVYSSYTYLLSCFASTSSPAGGRDGVSTTATTAPVLWYCPAAMSATPSAVAATVPPSGKRRQTSAEKTDVAASTTPTTATATSRGRGRKRKAEGGVDRAVLGNALRHDQTALERQVKARLAREVVKASHRLAHSPAPSSEVLPNLKTADDVVASVKGEDGSADHVEDRAVAKVEEAETSSAVSAPLSYPLSSPLSREEHPTTPSTSPSSPFGSPTSTTADTRPTLRSQTQRPEPPADFAQLTYAQQCLLVWTAGGLLERHDRQRRATEERRERLLARCGRMATRRMAARVAAVVERGLGEGAEQLVESLTHEESENDDSSEEDSDGGGNIDTRRSSAQVRQSRRRPDAEAAGEEGEGSDSDETSVSSTEALRAEMRPLPRRVFDYWAEYRSSGTSASVSVGDALSKQEL